GNTTIGGIGGVAGRWDIRETTTTAGSETSDASLNTLPPGSGYNLTKVGTNQISLVGVHVEPNLGDITVNSRMLSIELSTDSLGDPSKTLPVASGATLQLFNSLSTGGSPYDKLLALNGNGITNTLNIGSGANNALGGAITISGSNMWHSAANT